MLRSLCFALILPLGTAALAGGFAPSPYQHLDASVSDSVVGNPVTSWNDLSGNARNAVADIGSVTYPSALLFPSGRAGVHFGAQRNTLKLLNRANTEAVMDFNGSASGKSGFAVFLSLRVDTLRSDFNEIMGTSSNVVGFGLRVSPSPSATIQAYMGGTLFSRPNSDQKVQTGSALVIALNYDAATGRATLWDSLNDSEVSWEVPAGDFVHGDLTIGGLSSTRYIDGSIGEVQIFDRKLTQTEFNSLRGRMMLEWIGTKPRSPARPLAPTWTIDELLNWDPATDPTAPFNVSSVPLQDRIDVPAALKANTNAKSGQGGIQALDDYMSSLPQHMQDYPYGGAGGQDAYNFTYWQYLEETVYWGGVFPVNFVPPNGEMIDNAHRNGVTILGKVFFPPTVYGGNIEWVRTFLQKDGDRYPAADKLIQAAEYYGFDGWFINQETEGGNATDAAAMRDLIRYIRENSDITITWYDSMREDGLIRWQDRLSTSNDWYLRHNYLTGLQDASGSLIAHSMFIDFINVWNLDEATIRPDGPIA